MPYLLDVDVDGLCIVLKTTIVDVELIVYIRRTINLNPDDFLLLLLL